ncbi:unnamed protein product [Brachionus calyciflorus]|uniref:Uncharacterized protein n=1 Tax=Brachionus calyciflorus TaxID=104777 RepID=A0A814HS99_9BILA|nr:unnamed protein product [Brachionus calyciflorus]
MIAGKSQIVRQKNIDSEKMLYENVPSLCDGIMTNTSDEFEQINESIAKLTLKLNSESDDYTEFNFNCTNIHFDLTPSSSSSASSPSNLLNTDKSPRSLTCCSSPSKSSSNFSKFEPSQSPRHGKKEKFVKSSTLNSHHQNTAPLLSTNSVPLNIKANRLASFIRLDKASSFFSRSCPGEELTETTSETKNKNEYHQKFKNFLTFSSRIKSKKQDSSPNGSAHTSINSVFSDSITSSMNLETSENRFVDNKKGKIGSFEVDLEKLAKELVLPSVNAPLTSFKPPLQTSRTIDSESPKQTKKQFVRSLTQNKEN